MNNEITEWKDVPNNIARYMFGENFNLSLEDVKDKIRKIRVELKKYKRSEPMWKLYFKEIRILHAQVAWINARKGNNG